MHTVPSLADLEWLRGDRLDVVSISEFAIWFAFDSGGVIQADEPTNLIDRDGRAECHYRQLQSESWPFHKIVGSRVKDVIRSDDWNFEIIFENDFRLIITSNEGWYESGSITVPSGGTKRVIIF